MPLINVGLVVLGRLSYYVLMKIVSLRACLDPLSKNLLDCTSFSNIEILDFLDSQSLGIV